MTTESTIEGLKKQITELQTDETELLRLHTEKEQELNAMRAGKSRDYAAMAALEGQRSALNTMLTEQRGEIGQLQARVNTLEAQKARAVHLEEMGEHLKRVAGAREAAEAALAEVETVLAEKLLNLNTLRVNWDEQRCAAIQYGMAHLGLPHPQTGNHAPAEQTRRAWATFLQEMEGKGLPAQRLYKSTARHDPYNLSSGWDIDLTPGFVDYMRHRMGQGYPRPIKAAVARAFMTAFDSIPDHLQGVHND